MRKEKNTVYFSFIEVFDRDLSNVLILSYRLLMNGFVCKIVKGVRRVNKSEEINSDTEAVSPRFISLQKLKKFGFEKTREYDHDRKKSVIIWVKRPETISDELIEITEIFAIQILSIVRNIFGSDKGLIAKQVFDLTIGVSKLKKEFESDKKLGDLFQFIKTIALTQKKLDSNREALSSEEFYTVYNSMSSSDREFLLYKYKQVTNCELSQREFMLLLIVIIGTCKC